VFGLETMVILGVGGLVAAGVGASRWLKGAPYAPREDDARSLAPLGLELREGAFEGTLAGFPASVEPDAGSVVVRVTGLPGGWRIEPGTDGPVLDGVLYPIRPRQQALTALWHAVNRAEIDAGEGELRLEVPTFLADGGGLGDVVTRLSELLDVLRVSEPWAEVARDAKEGRELRLHGLRQQLGVGRAALEEVAADLLDDPDLLLRMVAECVVGDVTALRGFCLSDPARFVVEVLAFLPDDVRGEVLAARVTETKATAHPFVLDLLERQRHGQAPAEELRALAAGVHAFMDDPDPMFRATRFRGLDGALRPFAVAVEGVAQVDPDAARPWVPLCLEMLEEAEGTDAEALLDALALAATVEDLPALQRLGGAAARVVGAVQARAGGARGGLALAEQAGGELSVPEEPETDGGQPPGRSG